MADPAAWNARTDEEIVRRVQAGEGKLFSIIFERHYSRLERYVRHLGVGESDLEDVLAETIQLEEAWQEPDLRAEEPLEAVIRRAEVARIREAIERLSPSDREIITLSYDRELSCREIMVIMGKPSVTSVTTHLYKAMKRLREAVSRLEPAPGCRVPSG
jgi:RNA polymerase sigma factor (sigma-70 family)